MAFLRYSLVGAVATLAHYAVLLALVEWLHWPSPGAAATGATVGALVAYAGNRAFTFASTADVRTTLPRFALVALVGAGLNGLIVWVGTSGLGVHYLVAQVAASFVVLAVTFAFNRAWTFA